jgi:hypothetical protein
LSSKLVMRLRLRAAAMLNTRRLHQPQQQHKRQRQQQQQQVLQSWLQKQENLQQQVQQGPWQASSWQAPSPAVVTGRGQQQHQLTSRMHQRPQLQLLQTCPQLPAAAAAATSQLWPQVVLRMQQQQQQQQQQNLLHHHQQQNLLHQQQQQQSAPAFLQAHPSLPCVRQALASVAAARA